MQRNNSSNILGIIIVLIGVLLLVDNFDILFIPFNILSFLLSWPTILIIIGIIILSGSKDSFAGYLFLGLGAFFLLSRHYHFHAGRILADYWPVILIAFGLYIIWKRDKRIEPKAQNKFSDEAEYEEIYEEDRQSHSHSRIDDDYIDDTSIMSSGKKFYESDNFRGGKIISILGSNSIDLLDCKLAPGRQFLETISVLGATNIYVPRDWKVVINVVSIFGGFEDLRRKDASIKYNEDRVLVIKGFVLFGGGEIKN